MEKYFKEVKKALVCMPKAKKQILEQLKIGVEEYINNHPDCTRSDIEAHFGTPLSIAEENAASNGINYKKRLKINKTVKISIIIILALALVYAMTVCIGVYIMSHENDVYYYDIELHDNSSFT